MKITKSQLKQIIKEELEAARSKSTVNFQVNIPAELKRISAKFKVGHVEDKTRTDLQDGQYKIHCPGGKCELVYKNKFGVYFSNLGNGIINDTKEGLIDELMEKAGYTEVGRPDQPTTFVEGELEEVEGVPVAPLGGEGTDREQLSRKLSAAEKVRKMSPEQIKQLEADHPEALELLDKLLNSRFFEIVEEEKGKYDDTEEAK